MQPIVRYKMLGEVKGDVIQIVDLWHEVTTTVSACKLAVDEFKMAQFDGSDACKIGFICGTELEKTD
jgi:hypothetical protein